MLSPEKQTPERWKRVKEALDAALEVPPNHRTTVLERHLGEDSTLLTDARTYLGLDDEIGDFIERPALSLSPRSGQDPMLGRRVGPYKVERLLGRGGMGSVYLAVREDDYEKRVALKVMPHALSSGEMVDRFRKERQILAHLEHPNIARLLDGGTTDDGLPYFVMEYVEGRPIDRYCDAEHLSVSRRLELFRQVCSAVHFAHRNLVVHRDLKPGNILVTAQGVAKLLDFGIAKLLGSESVTRMLDREVGPMTYQYASPEQILGEPITTASDVYSLGVLLYEVVSGHLPYRREQYRHPLSVMKAIGSKEPPKPSTAIWRQEVRRSRTRTSATPESVSQTRGGDPGKLQRRLTGDVDAIVLKALRPEPEYRYSSVEQFSEDVRRHLKGRPVEARAGSFTYFAEKFIRRNQVALTTAAVFVAMVIAFMMMLASERDQARLERNRATMSMDLLVQFLENPELADDEGLTAEGVIQRGIDLLGEEFAKDLEAQANTLSNLGLMHSYRGSYDQARMLQKKALEMRREMWGADHPLVAESLHNLAFLLALEGENQEAASLSREAVEIQRKHYREPHPHFATGISNLASLLRAEHKEEAGELYREALEMKRQLYGPEHLEIATTLANLGTLYFGQGVYESAREYYQDALRIRQKYLPADHNKLASSFNHMGTVLIALGQYHEAIPMFRNSLEIRLAHQGGDHPEVTGNMNNLAFSLARIGEYVEAEEHYRRALEIRIAHFGDQHSKVATVKKNLAALLIMTGDPAAAEPLAREALDTFIGSTREGHWRIADARSVVGACLSTQRRYREAEKWLLESFSALRQQKGDTSFYTQDARRRIVQLYVDWGRPEEAEKYRQ